MVLDNCQVPFFSWVVARDAAINKRSEVVGHARRGRESLVPRWTLPKHWRALGGTDMSRADRGSFCLMGEGFPVCPFYAVFRLSERG